MVVWFVRLIPLACLALVTAGSVGCGGANTNKDGATLMTDIEGVEQFIASVDDMKEITQTFGKAFASGTAPPRAELQKYQKYSFQLNGKPDMKQGEATVSVKIFQKDKEVATKEWVVVKEGDSWKIKSAPLP